MHQSKMVGRQCGPAVGATQWLLARWEACCLANSLEAPALLLLRATPTRFKLSSHHLEKQTSIFYPFQLVIPLLIFLDSQPHTVVNQLYQQTPGHHLQVKSRLLFEDLDQVINPLQLIILSCTRCTTPATRAPTPHWKLVLRATRTTSTTSPTSSCKLTKPKMLHRAKC